MPRLRLLYVMASALCCNAVALAADDTNGNGGVIPNFGLDGTAWTSNRPASDDFLPPISGPGPVLSDPAHPYVPNGQGQSTYRVADVSNPILKPWVVAQMKKANDEVLAGKVPLHCARKVLSRRSSGDGRL